MLKHRVIPCLLLKNGGLVKTLKFSNPKYVGDPINAIRIFNEKEVDELMVLDIGVSKENREPNYAVIEQIAGECFMPLCYGGGINSFDQAQKLFAIGVEKICIQNAAMIDLNIIEQIAKKFGNQSVIASVDVKKNWLGRYQLFSAKTGNMQKESWEQYLLNVVSAGAGEVVLNAVDRDGTMCGMDLDLIKKGASAVNVPLIAIGGLNSLSDIKAAVNAGASAIAAGAFFVFYGPHRAVLITYPSYQELETLLNTY